MRTIARLMDARNTAEGKFLSVLLSVLLVFSFLNVTMFTDYANAEGEEGEATEFAEPAGEPGDEAQPEDAAGEPVDEKPQGEVNETELPGEGGSDEEGVQEPDAGKGANEEAASQEQETDQEDSGNAPVATNEPAIEPREVSPSNVIDGTNSNIEGMTFDEVVAALKKANVTFEMHKSTVDGNTAVCEKDRVVNVKELFGCKNNAGPDHPWFTSSPYISQSTVAQNTGKLEFTGDGTGLTVVLMYNPKGSKNKKARILRLLDRL